jgi:Mg2+ and Co2+ transporter CorA
MHVFQIGGEGCQPLAALPATLPEHGFLWVAFEREVFVERATELQSALLGWGITPIVDLHVSDLLNPQLPSHYEDTSWYDLLVFRRLLAVPSVDAPATHPVSQVETRPVGFVVFDRLLVTVHAADGHVREHFAQRLAQMAQGSDSRSASRLPTSPSDLMLRMVNHIVDSYLDLRRLLTKQLGDLQHALLDPKNQILDWQVLLDARNTLHLLDDTCEDQRSAMQEWIDAFEELPAPADAQTQRERELLRVRARDVLEHIERVLTHVRRLEQSAETAVQMHFAAVGQRTNDIMRTLTVLTAIFLPLNLITGIFGMNFETLPLIHKQAGFWIALGVMGATGVGLGLYFWRKRYLSSHARP